MTQTEISFMGSASSASSFLITPFVWYFLNKLGRKRTLILFHLPQLIAWIILVTINKVEAVLSAMFISGLSGSTFLIIPVFVSEYCEVSIRGAMMSGHIIFYELGIMISYFFGGFLEYTTIMYISLIMSAVALGMICCITESPLYLIQKEREEEAVKSIQFYRGLKKNCSEISREVECIRKILNFDCGNNDSDEKQSLKKDDILSEKLSFIQILTKSRTTRRIVFKLLFIQTVSIFQGLIVVQVFAKPLLQFAVPSMSATLSTVLFALVVAISSLIGAYLLDTVGRRPLFINAATATGLCCVILGTQLHFNWGPSWLTAVFMNLYFFFYILGAGTIPTVLIGELFLPETRIFAAVLCAEWSFLCNFILLSIFIPLEKSFGLGAIFYIFAVCSFITAIATSILIPETMGLRIDEIQLKLLRNRK